MHARDKNHNCVAYNIKEQACFYSHNPTFLLTMQFFGTVKRHLYACEKNMRTRQNWRLEKLTRFLFMCFSVSCIIMYSMIKIYAVQIYANGA